MSKEDKAIWKKLVDERVEEQFNTEPGGENAKPLPQKTLFRKLEEKKQEDKLKLLKDEVKELRKDINNIKSAINAINRKARNTPMVEEKVNENKDK